MRVVVVVVVKAIKFNSPAITSRHSTILTSDILQFRREKKEQRLLEIKNNNKKTKPSHASLIQIEVTSRTVHSRGVRASLAAALCTIYVYNTRRNRQTDEKYWSSRAQRERVTLNLINVDLMGKTGEKITPRAKS